VGSTLAPEKYIVVAKVDPVNMKLGDEVEIRTFFTHNCSNVLTNICCERSHGTLCFSWKKAN